MCKETNRTAIYKASGGAVRIKTKSVQTITLRSAPFDAYFHSTKSAPQYKRTCLYGNSKIHSLHFQCSLDTVCVNAKLPFET